MCPIEDAGLAVVELTEQQHHALRDECDVGRRHDQCLWRIVELRAQIRQKPLRILQVLDDVEQQHVVVSLGTEREWTIQILLKHLHVRVGFRLGRELIDDGYSTTIFEELSGKSTWSRADVQHAGAGRHCVERKLVAARISQLQIVVCVLSLVDWVEAPLIENARSMRDVLQRHLQHVGRVLHAVHATDLIAVVRRDRQLEDPLPAVQ